MRGANNRSFLVGMFHTSTIVECVAVLGGHMKFLRVSPTFKHPTNLRLVGCYPNIL